MAMEKIGMNKLREIFRLRYEQKQSIRKIGVSCRTSHRTVAKYLRLAEQNGLNWAEDKHLDDTALENKVCGKRSTLQVVHRKVIPDWEYIHGELKRSNVTLQLLHQEYKEEHQEAGYEYSYFGEMYQRWKKTLNICMRQEHKAGEKLFVDYCDGEGVGIIDRESGVVRKTQIYVSSWGVSNYTYAEAGYSQEKRDWLMSHVRAFEYFDRVPHITVPDNLKAGVKDPCLYEPELNRSYVELAQHYGFTVIPARRSHPKDKAKVEKSVNLVQRWILACLRNRKFYSLTELNAAIRELLIRLNRKKLRKIGKTRQELFETLDKPAALPLPEKRYEYASWKKCRVNIDYHVEIESHYYSVPYQLIHEQVEARVTESIVEIFYKGRRQASHARSSEKWKYTTNPEHMPEAHRKYRDQTPSKLLEWAKGVGMSTVEMVKNILESRKYIQQSYRSCMGLKRLEGYYGRERIESACRRAVKYGTYSYRSVKAILVGGLDRQSDLSVKETGIFLPRHANIRGKGYYDDKSELN